MIQETLKAAGLRHILVIDESQSAREMVVSILSSLDADIIQAKNGEEALDILHTQSIDLVITDMEMPGISGIDLCTAIRADKANQGIPVIILSVYDSETAIEEGYKAGAEAYISKNEIKRSLLKTVHQVLAKFKFQRGKKILVVEDSKTIRKMVTSGLADAGFAVKQAQNGREAYERLQDEIFDLVLSDIEMPEFDGFRLVELIQSDPDLATVPVIVMSTHEERSYIKRIIMLGAVNYLVKPFNIDQLVAMIERTLSDRFILLHKEKERADMERKLILASISSLVLALEARDYYTRGHSEAVSTIVSGMLSLFGGTEKQINDISMAGMLHDIGKIGVRDSILLKPGTLTSAEFDQLKMHPVTGASILNSIPSLYNVIPVVKFHHERFDGAGYPEGLKGKEIPFWARMTSVADTYHALTSDRPYRNAIPREKALVIVDEVSGTQLCPECVALFHQWISQSG